ncbi:MAG: Ig-like domain-containing protein [Acidimicrobiales bacterium]
MTKRRWINATLALSIAMLLLPLTPASSGAAPGATSVAVAPQAFGANYTTPTDHELTVSLTAFSFDGEPIVDWTITSEPEHGTLDDCSEGTCLYQPNAGFVGTDTFTFTAFDGSFFSNEAIITILVVPACQPGACIDNGTVLLAINPEGHLNVGNASGSAAGDRNAGLQYLPTAAEGTASGCACEGWGVAEATTGIAGSANVSVGGIRNLDLIEFRSTPTTARSVVSVDDTMAVTHHFHPSPQTDALYEIEVTIENISVAVLDDILYRRVIDWDAEPTPYQEFVTVDTGNATNVLFASNDGFADPNPLSPRTDRGRTGSFEDAGPGDQGAMFDFAFGSLAPGERVTFRLFYGAAANEIDAVAAVAATGAEVYSFGQPNTENGAAIGAPNTFILAFAAVGGLSVFAPVANDDELVVEAGIEATLDVLANDTDPNGDPLGVVNYSDPAGGDVDCTEAGLCTYVSDPGFVGEDSFTYTIADGRGGEATGMVYITVTEPPVPVNLPPVVSAGLPIEAAPHELVTLDGSAFDPDGDPLFVAWTTGLNPIGVAGSCTFGDPMSPVTTVSCSAVGRYELTLTAIDGNNPPASQSTAITVIEPPIPVNLPPIVSAGLPIEAGPNELVILNGSAVDPDGDPLVFNWTTDPGNTCTIGTPGSANTTVTCSAYGDHDFTLTVTDGHNIPVAATTSVNIIEPPIPVNLPPAVSAGLPVETGPNEPVLLDGSAEDPDGDPLAFDWSVDPATPCELTSPTSPDTLITCTAPGVHLVTLTVHDGYNLGVSGTTTVTVTAFDPIFPVNDPPLVSAGVDLTTGPGEPFRLDGAVFDPDGDAVTVTWLVEPDPFRGLSATCDFAEPSELDTSVTCSEVAVFALTLIADDGHNPKVSDTVLVTVTTTEPSETEGDPTETLGGQPDVEPIGAPNGEPFGAPGAPKGLPRGVPGAGPKDCAAPAMQLELQTNSFLGNRDGHRLSEMVDVVLSCDRYRILLGSADPSHKDGYQRKQTHERWYLEGLDIDGNVVFRSPLTNDLADDQTSSVDDVGIADLSGVVKLRARHAGLGTSVNSIHELTVRLDPVGGP